MKNIFDKIIDFAKKYWLIALLIVGLLIVGWFAIDAGITNKALRRSQQTVVSAERQKAIDSTKLAGLDEQRLALKLQTEQHNNEMKAKDAETAKLLKLDKKALADRDSAIARLKREPSLPNCQEALNSAIYYGDSQTKLLKVANEKLVIAISEIRTRNVNDSINMIAITTLKNSNTALQQTIVQSEQKHQRDIKRNKFTIGLLKIIAVAEATALVIKSL
jgi:hypothetical protein